MVYEVSPVWDLIIETSPKGEDELGEYSEHADSVDKIIFLENGIILQYPRDDNTSFYNEFIPFKYIENIEYKSKK